MDFPSCSSLMEAWMHRAAVKSFDPARKIPAEDWRFLMEALALAPSSYGLQPFRVIEIRGAALRESLREAAYGQAQIAEADRLLLFAVLDDFGEIELEAHLGRLREIRGLPEEALGVYRGKVLDRVLHVLSPVQRRAWQAKQAYLALGTLLAQAALRGIDTCPMEAIDLEAWNRLLDLEWKGMSAVCACAVGYRADGDVYSRLPKVRLPADEFLLVHEG